MPEQLTPESVSYVLISIQLPRLCSLYKLHLSMSLYDAYNRANKHCTLIYVTFVNVDGIAQSI